MKKFIKIVTDILLVIVLVMAAVLYIPRLMGLKTYKVLSGSMEPEYHVGSVVYVENHQLMILRLVMLLHFILMIIQSSHTGLLIKMMTLRAFEPKEMRMR